MNKRPRNQVALEISRQWATRSQDRLPDRCSFSGFDGFEWTALEYPNVPLLCEEPINSEELDSEVVQRVALDAIAIKVALRGRISAYLRPLGAGDTQDFRPSELLDLESATYAAERDAMIEKIYCGQERRALVARNRTLMAYLGPMPPTTLNGVPVVTREELTVLYILRESGARLDEIEHELRAWLNRRSV